MQSNYEKEAASMLADLDGRLTASSEARQEAIEHFAKMKERAKENEYELARREVEAEFNSLFAATWSAEMPGLSLSTDACDRLQCSPEPYPNSLSLRVDDMDFDPDPGVYHGQLRAATIRELAAALLDHDVDDLPTLPFVSLVAELTSYISRQAGFVAASAVINLGQFGLSDLRTYMEAGREEFDKRFVATDLADFVNGLIPGGIVAQFEADGGALDLVDDDELRASLSDDEHNAIGAAEAACDGEGMLQVLSAAATRLHLRGVAR